MKLFKLLTISILLSIGSASAYERFKYETELTRLYLNPGIKPDCNFVCRMGEELGYWTERIAKEWLSQDTKKAATSMKYYVRINNMYWEYASTLVYAQTYKG